MKVNVEAEQINLWDNRFYFVVPQEEIPEHLKYLEADGGIYLPSSTHILDVAYAKGKQFENWLKDVGHSAKIISEIAAQKGSRVHRACELLLLGEEISFDTVIDVETTHIGKHMTMEEWYGVLRFKEFFDTVKPTDYSPEIIAYNLEDGYAGTVDLPCTINGERWVIDIKFSSAIHESYFLQVESYARCLEDIDRVGILHLRALTRGADKKGKKIQGKGWVLAEPPVDRDELFKVWKHLLGIYKFRNLNETPKSITIEKTVKL